MTGLFDAEKPQSQKDKEGSATVSEAEKKVENAGEKGLIFVYPELWHVMPEKDKKGILEVGRLEVAQAIGQKNFDRAQRILNELKDFFGEKEVKDLKSEFEKYKGKAKPESALAQELRAMFHEKDWQKMRQLLAGEKAGGAYSRGWFYFNYYAALMKSFDSSRFQKDVGERELETVKKSVRKMYGLPLLWQLCAIRDILTLLPEMSKEIINDVDWYEIVSEIQKEMKFNDAYAITALAILKKVNPELYAAKFEGKTSKDFWRSAKEQLAVYDHRNKDRICISCSGLLKDAHNVNPDEFPVPTITKKQWEHEKEEMSRDLADGYPDYFIRSFKFLKDVEVQD